MDEKTQETTDFKKTLQGIIKDSLKVREFLLNDPKKSKIYMDSSKITSDLLTCARKEDENKGYRVNIGNENNNDVSPLSLVVYQQKNTSYYHADLIVNTSQSDKPTQIPINNAGNLPYVYEFLSRASIPDLTTGDDFSKVFDVFKMQLPANMLQNKDGLSCYKQLLPLLLKVTYQTNVNKKFDQLYDENKQYSDVELSQMKDKMDEFKKEMHGTLDLINSEVIESYVSDVVELDQKYYNQSTNGKYGIESEDYTL